MKQKEILSLSIIQLIMLFRREFPFLSDLAESSRNAQLFKKKLREAVIKKQKNQKDVCEQILLLLEYDGHRIQELSTGEKILIQPLTYLWQFLTGHLESLDISVDLFIDLFFLFKRLEGIEPPDVSLHYLNESIDRWPSARSKNVKQVRTQNKERILRLLIQKIDARKSSSSRFHFDKGMRYKEKYQQVNIWWNDFKFHLAMAVKSPTELNCFLNDSLSTETMSLLSEARKKGMPFFATPYYLSLLDVTGVEYDDGAIRSYVIYSPQLVETFGNIRAWEKEDAVEVGKPNAAGWLLPNAYNIHRRYPDVAILIPDTMGRACGGLCASCQRMYDFQSKHLNFEFKELLPKESWEHKLHTLMTYFEEDTQLRDILITGGDALMSQNKTLQNILNSVYHMACNKHKANMIRPDGEKYAELQRVRLGSRLLAYLPMRVNDELIEILKEFKEKASTAGVKQFIIQTHFQSPLEVTQEARKAIHKILSAGWLITNQLVYTTAVSRRGHTARLRQVLNSLGVLCYYTFSVKGFNENYAVYTPNSRSLQEQHEEKKLGRLTKEQAEELSNELKYSTNAAASIQGFMKKYQLPFLATDRSVLNLPAVGKSMSFQMVGITLEGKRVLRFNHDHSRRHSPIIDKMGDIHIAENKSVAAYLRQLQQMGEKVDNYSTIWKYTQGETEPRFKLYEYPDFPFRVTDRLSNIRLTE